MEENKNNKLIGWIVTIIILLLLILVGYVVYDKLLKVDKIILNDDRITTTTPVKNEDKYTILDLSKKEELPSIIESGRTIDELTEDNISELEEHFKIKLEKIDSDVNYSYNNGEIKETIKDVKKIYFDLTDGNLQTLFLAIITNSNEVWVICGPYSLTEKGYMSLESYDKENKKWVELKPELKKLNKKYTNVKIVNPYEAGGIMFVGLSDNKYYELPEELELNKDISFNIFANKYHITTNGNIVFDDEILDFIFKFGLYENGIDARLSYIISNENYLYKVNSCETSNVECFEKVSDKKISKVEYKNGLVEEMEEKYYGIVKIYFEDGAFETIKESFIFESKIK